MSITEFRKLVIIIWLVVVAAMSAIWGQRAWTGQSWDTDDFMRLTQVRDWLSGQEFRDLTQHRLNPPDGTPMHWSRLADLPLAAVALALSPVLALDDALTVAAMVVPPLFFLLFLVVFAYPARLMLGAGRSPIGLLAALCGAGLPAQFAPGRVDHHGLQLILIIAAISLLLAGLARQRWRRAIGFAAIPFALSIWIGVELLPLIAAWFAVLGLIWCWRGGDLALYGAIAAGLGGAIGLILLLVTVDPALWAAPACDAFSAMPVSVLLLIGAGFALMHGCRHRLHQRLAGAMTGAILAALVFAKVFPDCLGGGYGAVDPLVRKFWLGNVGEAMPLLTQAQYDPFAAIGKLWPCALGLGYALWRCARAPGDGRVLWGALAFLILAAAALVFWQIRAATIAQTVALIPLGGLIADLWRRVKGAGPRLVQLLLLLPILFVSSAMFWPALSLAGRVLAPPAPGGPTKVTATCESRRDLPLLAAQPTALALTYIDVGPMLLFATPHAVLAGPYHRDNEGLRATIELFRSADDAWIAARLKQLGIDWVVICPGPENYSVYRTERSDGLAERLAAGQVPVYLEAAPDLEAAGLKLYRVRP